MHESPDRENGIGMWEYVGESSVGRGFRYLVAAADINEANRLFMEEEGDFMLHTYDVHQVEDLDRLRIWDFSAPTGKTRDGRSIPEEISAREAIRRSSSFPRRLQPARGH